MISSYDLKQNLKMDIIISSEMAEALREWSSMYINKASWLAGAGNIKSMNLPATIASEIARLVTIEMEVSITGSPRADFIAEQLEPVLDNIRALVEYASAKGGLVMKPYPLATGGVGIDFVQADQFFPVMFDSNRKITGIIFVDQRRVGSTYYTRLESHIMEGTSCRIRNRVFRSTDKDTLGYPASFSDISDWENLAEEAVIRNLKKPLFAYFRYPMANSIDPASPLGVSCYSRAVDLIKEADIQWTDFRWEFESGRRALYADPSAFEKDKQTGKLIIPFKRLYRTLKSSGNIGDKSKLFEEWTPTLREENLLNGLNSILKNIELSCGLAFGTISELNDAVPLTATEVRMSKQRTYATVVDTQKALKNALDDLIYAIDTWATLSKLSPSGKYDVTYSFDDSVVTDKDSQFIKDTQAVSLGFMGGVEFRMRNYSETLEKATEMIAMVGGPKTIDDLVTGE